MGIKLHFPVPQGQAQFRQYMRLSDIATQMRIAGWRVDVARVKEHRRQAENRQRRMREVFADLSGKKELGKDGQTQAVKDYFWQTLGLPVVSYDKKTRKPKLDAAALLAYATEYEDPKVKRSAAALYGYRKSGKTMGFCDEYLAANGRVHPVYNVTGTKGSRWSCASPNIQQLPSKTIKYDFGDGPEPIAVSMKDILIADEGFVLVDADWAALELYLQTYIARAKKLIECIRLGLDLHMYNARVMFGENLVPPGATKKTHKNFRNAAKLAFGFAYNASDNISQVHKTMKEMLPQITEQLCQELRKRYFAHHPEFPKWQKWTMREINEKGFISTPILSRRLYLPANTRGYNQALNSQCQITGGDLANAAIIKLYDSLRWSDGEQIRAQVHDAFVVQTRPEWAEQTAHKLVSAMTQPIEIYGTTAKFVAEPGLGYHWGDMAELKL